ncbi:hypothetical protein VC83_00696 [Pseudogymnoascus destructans]|uniref:MINDY deubiquitinase domain-containing protein n=1 Tax=Pseudogymnoascus destructans TaxID=655981 RepID=A0A177AMA3_9PEZI|nr:uncharacterized protein VC83_00696 [Pseudogymnoascus destructans]OAF62451.1 hypothetical protein VC83_00696 [Pseudogymnoascus destructans]
MVSRKQEPDEGVPTGGGGNTAGAPQTQRTQGGGEGAGSERREQGGGPAWNEIPESLRSGPRGGAESMNPFARAQNTGNPPASGSAAEVNPWVGEEEKGGPGSSVPDANAPGPRAPDASAPGASGPSPPSQHQDSNVTDQFQNLNIADQSTNSWEGPVEQKSTAEEKPQPNAQPVPPSFGKEYSGNDAWSSVPPPTRAPPPVNVDDTNESSNWDDDQMDLFRTPAGNRVVTEEAESASEEAPGESSRQDAGPAPVVPQKEPMREDGGSEPTGAGEQQSGVIDAAGHEASSQRPIPPRPPNLPPRNIGDSEEATTSHDENSGGEANAPPPRQDVRNSEEKSKETYAIRNITWFDVRARENPRITPVLMQNANGPCPLLALVNALTISTPQNLATPLIETLRTREQISLELLLTAVLDDLMSEQREDGTEELPDITDLYTFLITLHTGMNVNPSFFAPAATNLANDPRRSMSHIHPSEREDMIPGTFEQTREIMLYGTFLIPLIHGWLPEPGSDAQAALARSARTYEDAQHLMFREEDLEMKFIGEGLTLEEQTTLDDIMTIKTFLSSSGTQLTNSGLETIRKALAPGSVAILFRNDHFSTLYKNPQNDELMHLVTDMGLAGHDEIVWESLPDINGQHCAFYSGDFRPVGGDTQSRQAASDGDSRLGGSEASTDTNAAPSGRHRRVASSSAEQEDHDLALAIQLQEEENERHEEEIARRRRESGNTQKQQGKSSRARNTSSNDIRLSRSDGAGSSGPRGGNAGGSSQSQAAPAEFPLESPPLQTSNLPSSPDETLPSYEHAATQPAFDPPPHHPAHPNVSPEVGRRLRGLSATARQAERIRLAQARPQPRVQPLGGGGIEGRIRRGGGEERTGIVLLCEGG